MHSLRLLWRGGFAGLVFLVVTAVAGATTLRLFTVGNSFSNNATHYLPELAAAGGHELILGKAQTGGCSLERHWVAAEAGLANPDDAKAKIYGGKSLVEQLGTGTWDVITIQQYSLLSADPATYHPFAEKLHAYLKQLQPGAEIVVHQTWAYRTDAAKFAQTGPGKNAATAREMWERSRAAYRELAQQFHARLLPVGDAFWRVNSDPQWAFKPDASFKEKTAMYPALPDQTHSLHVGWRWTKPAAAAAKAPAAGEAPQQVLGKDANHANAAGEYLGALVWYGMLFKESPEKLTWAPPGVAPDFAAHLRRVAAEVVKEAGR